MRLTRSNGNPAGARGTTAVALLFWACVTSTGQVWAAEPSADPLEEVMVTGSRVQRSNFTAPTPTTVMTSEDIALTSATNVGQLVWEMPQFQPTFAPTTTTTMGTGAGANTYDLRGLGLTRTLVLIDGRRHVPTSLNGALDTNSIPAGAIERVEVVTGGASAAYGSDAIAGVVNIILRKNFDGLEGSIQAGESFRGDYQEVRGTLNFGTGFADQRGRLLVALEAADNNGVFNQSSRDWARGGWGVVNNPTFTPTNGQYARFLTSDARVGNATFGGLITSGVLAGTEFVSATTTRQFDPGAYPFNRPNTIGGDGPDLTGIRTLAIPLERQTAYTRASFAFTDNVTAFIEGNYARSSGHNSRLALSFNAANNALTIRQDNAFLPADLRAIMAGAGEESFRLGRIDSDFGFYDVEVLNETRQVIAGLEGRFGNGWRWDAYYALGRNQSTSYRFNDAMNSRLNLAADAVVNPANGETVCRSTLTTPGNGCVPINLFGVGSPSQAALEYVTDDITNNIDYDQDVTEASVQGEPFSTWAGPVSVVAGAGYRKEAIAQNSDPNSLLRLHSFYNPQPQQGSYNIREGFGETVIPLLHELPLAQSLEFNGAVRWTDHSTTGSVTTWKAGLTYDVTEQLRFRATRSQDIRSPSFEELFLIPNALFQTITDLNGVVAPVLTQIASNPDLKPEEASTWTAGIVYQPSWATGLRVSFDYYKIDMTGRVAVLAAQRIVDACGAGDPTFCAFLIRDSDGNLIRVDTPNFNAGLALWEGEDVEIAYVLPVDNLRGDLTFRAIGSHAKHGRTDIRGVITEDVGDAIPRWRANASVTYSNERLTLRLAGRYVDGVDYDRSFGPLDIDVQDFSGKFYLNAGFQYLLPTSMAREFQLFANVDNVLDTAPPIIPGFTGPVPPPVSRYTLYDPIGRRFTLGARVRF